MSNASKKRAAALVCVPLLLGLLPGAAAAETPLTPELATLAEPAVATAPEAVQAEATALPAEGPGSIVREGGDLVVEARFGGDAAARTAALEAAGATVLDVSRQYQTVALSIAPEDLGALAAVPGLEVVEPSLQPVFYGVEGDEEGAGTAAGAAAASSNGLCEGGSVTSQAMTQLRVAAARGAFGARGAGQTIGVISDSYDIATESIEGGAISTHAAEDEASNDLPGPLSTCSGQQVPVDVIAEGPTGGTDEGRAMLQAIHDLAPHAELAFATAYSTELEFARNIERLARPIAAGGAGADVIVDDVSYFGEPYFQDGPVAVAIRKVTEAGVTYLTAAGNDNLVERGTGNQIASWERSEFKDAECPSAVAVGIGKASSKTCMNFSPTGTDTTFGITVERESQLIVDLQWAEPWFGVEADLDAYLLNAAGEVIVAEPVSNTGNGSGVRRQPLEFLSWENKGSRSAEVQLVIDRCIQSCNGSAKNAARPRLKFILMENGAGVSRTEYPQSDEAAGITVGPTIYGHAGAAAAITVAAVNYEQSETAPAEPERYSSRGPVTHYFGPVNGSTAAARLASPENVAKPDLTATDCASTTFFATRLDDGWHFCGTSEAAPHAAAVAALMRQTRPAATPGQVLAALGSSATPFTPVNEPAAVGAGMVDAQAAITEIGGSPVSDPASTVIGAVQRTAPVQVATVAPPSGEAPKPTPPVASKPRPRVSIVSHPKALERTRKAGIVGRFRFAADEAGVRFYCQVDRGAQRPCGARFKRRFGIGRHVVQVRAVDASDNSASAPATFRFRVKRTGR
ncbi:MAG TPA: S8 family serine peptidase [Solirubrobacterales bacterium]|nr:S8 family serine peptidase [Solirubrobacterales bacterium]